MKHRSKISCTVRGRIFTPNKLFILMVHEKTGALRDDDGLPRYDTNGRQIIKSEGWGLFGGGHRDDDCRNVWETLVNQACDQSCDDQRVGWLATLLRELWEETGICSNEIHINPSAFIFEVKRGELPPNHQTVVFDGEYLADYNQIKLCPTDNKIIEARWVPIADVISGRFDEYGVYKSHLRIIRNDIEPDYILS